ncbi:unnamed protein product, partial [Trichogramma brassicae]
MGGSRHLKYNKLTRDIWQWCEQRSLWLYASYIPGRDNTQADAQSRVKNIDTEWELASYAFKRVVHIFGTPDIDLFASRVNSKCKRYCSWYRDPDAEFIDAFTISWANVYFYAFPPFAIIAKVLRKIILDKACGVVIVPYWTSQT